MKGVAVAFWLLFDYFHVTTVINIAIGFAFASYSFNVTIHLRKQVVECGNSLVMFRQHCPEIASTLLLKTLSK